MKTHLAIALIICCMSCRNAIQPSQLKMGNPAIVTSLSQQPFQFPVVPMPQPKPEPDINPAHYSALRVPQYEIKEIPSIQLESGTNYTLIVTPGDTNANIYNLWTTVDDSTYAPIGSSASTNFTVTGTNIYAVSESDSNGVFAESAIIGDMFVPPWQAPTNLVLWWTPARSNVTIEISADLSHWSPLTNLTGSNTIFPLPFTGHQFYRAATIDQPPIALNFETQ